MPSHHIHITGASGAGTTTLAQALGQKRNYPVLDADDYFWLPTQPPFQQKRAREERVTLLKRDRDAHSSSIISGSIVGWDETLEQSFDLIVFLWIPTELRLARLRRREMLLRGQVNEKFMAWAALYDTGDVDVRSLALHEQWLAKRRCPVLRLEGDLTVEERLARTLAALGVS